VKAAALTDRALLIDTENTFRPERISQIAAGLDLDLDGVLETSTFYKRF